MFARRTDAPVELHTVRQSRWPDVIRCNVYTGLEQHLTDDLQIDPDPRSPLEGADYLPVGLLQSR